jgi:hypothetical protein
VPSYFINTQWVMLAISFWLQHAGGYFASARFFFSLAILP